MRAGPESDKRHKLYVDGMMAVPSGGQTDLILTPPG